MSIRNPRRLLTAALGLGFGAFVAAGPVAPARAQVYGGTESLSSGSGEGTGTGTGGGRGINSLGGGTGRITGPGSLNPESLLGPGSESTYGLYPGAVDIRNLRERLRQLPGGARPSPGARSQPGLPSDVDIVPPSSLLNPFDGSSGVPTLSPEQIKRIDDTILPNARRIADPADRALAMERVARTKIFNAAVYGQSLYREASQALAEAFQATDAIPKGLTRDLRLMGIVATYLTLAQEERREGLAIEPLDPSADVPAAPKRTAQVRMDELTSASSHFNAAARAASAITSQNFESEEIFRVVQARAEHAKEIAIDAGLTDSSRTDLGPLGAKLLSSAEREFDAAASDAELIERHVWRDRALEEITIRATESDLYAQGLAVARRIPLPGMRNEALLRVAEGLARKGLAEEATGVYTEAARAVASIADADPRGVAAGVLLDSLISVGRFEDARAASVLMPDPQRRLNALGAIAESQGRRGIAAAAFAWIDRDVAENYRPYLRRKVEDGVISAIDTMRTQSLTREATGLGPAGSATPPPPARPAGGETPNR